MDCKEAILTRRTIRFFKQASISDQILIDLIEAGRRAPSGGNFQPLEYVIVNDKDTVAKIFDQVAWGAWVKPHRTPAENNRPVAFIAVLINHDIHKPENRLGDVDAAAAIENIMLSAWSEGIGSCWMGAINCDNIRRILSVPDNFAINSVIALGYPDESPVLQDTVDDSAESKKYYLDGNNVLHIPKRPVKSVTHFNMFGKQDK